MSSPDNYKPDQLIKLGIFESYKSKSFTLDEVFKALSCRRSTFFRNYKTYLKLGTDMYAHSRKNQKSKFGIYH